MAWLGTGCRDGRRIERRDLLRWRSGAGVRARIVQRWPGAWAAGAGVSKAPAREGWAGRWRCEVMPAQTSTASTEQVKPSAETPNPSGNLDGVEAQVTTERLLSAL